MLLGGESATYLEEMFFEYLKSLEPNPAHLDLFGGLISDKWKAMHECQAQEKMGLEREIRVLEEKTRRIDALVIPGTLDEITYRENLGGIKNEIMLKTMELSDLKIDLNDIRECVEYCKFYVSQVADLWLNANLHLKQRFQNFIFPHGVHCGGKIIRAKETALIFSHFQVKTKAEYTMVALKLLGLNQIMQEMRNIYAFRELVPISQIQNKAFSGAGG